MRVMATTPATMAQTIAKPPPMETITMSSVSSTVISPNWEGKPHESTRDTHFSTLI